MFDLRSPLIAVAAPAGVTVAALGWLVLGTAPPAAGRLDALGERFGALRGADVAARPFDSAVARALSAPLFVAPAAQGGELQLRLSGLAIAGGRKAALVAVGDKPPAWLALGDNRDGVTLVDVDAARATFETPAGVKTLELGAAPGPAQAAPAPSNAPK